MNDAEFEEKEKRRRMGMIYYFSMAMLETIRSYGLTATLDFLVRVSNHDNIVNELLPYLPRIANTAMLGVSNTKRGSKITAENPEEPVAEA